ncbi:hypothetical protein BJX61DRAFT_542031 [Aspergillus egyptiacus]|nr:hypothetical protein BJX61DRAFT_542031 [Aspergillus egyptiacus]
MASRRSATSTSTPTKTAISGAKSPSFEAGCRANRAQSSHQKKIGLEDTIELVVCDCKLGPEGWFFSGRTGSSEKDPLYGFTEMSELYFKAVPGYSGRYTVPVLCGRRS